MRANGHQCSLRRAATYVFPIHARAVHAMVHKVPAKVPAKTAGKRKHPENASSPGELRAHHDGGGIFPPQNVKGGDLGANLDDGTTTTVTVVTTTTTTVVARHAPAGGGAGAGSSGGVTAVTPATLAGGAALARTHANHHAPLVPQSESPRLDANKQPPKGKEAKGGSRFKGVYVDKAVAHKWKASIRLKHKEIHLGYYETEEGAARAYDKASLCAKGFAKNFTADGDFSDEEMAVIKNFAGDVEALRVTMGIGLGAKALSSQNRGVCIEKKTGKWRAEIQINGKKESLGYHQHESDAVAAYDRACIVARGLQKARTNKPLSTYASEMAGLEAFGGSFVEYQATLATKARRNAHYSSPFRGVRRHAHAAKKGDVTVKWRAEITVDGKKKSLGYHNTENDAAAAYDAFAKTLPNFNTQWLNFGDGGAIGAANGTEAGSAADETLTIGNGSGADGSHAGGAARTHAPPPQIREKALGGTKGKKAAAAAAAAAAEGNAPLPVASPTQGYVASLEDE